jgi:hypothetical protein
MPILETGSFPDIVIILVHSAAEYKYSRTLPRYMMWDDRFDDIATYLDPGVFAAVFSENFEKALLSGMPFITMPYTPLLAKVLDDCLHKDFSGSLDKWLCISFFHDDEDTAKITFVDGEDPLVYKARLLEGLNMFPFIKKITIPYDLLITYPALCEIIENTVEDSLYKSNL